MKIGKTDLDGVLLIEPNAFNDHRGQFAEIYNQEIFADEGVDLKFIQDDVSISKKNVLRGIHGDNVTWKLASCLLGEIYIVIIVCDQASDQFGKWQAFNLSEEHKQQLLVPPKHGIAHLALSDKVMLHYKQTTYYDPTRQFSYKWNDQRFNISWPIKDPILSKRDELGRYLGKSK
ncbi:MAG: dTDP-4-dehydrorhamnose 3,5-epimerase family protein [Candidatus Margulisiibacteriota bacterium]